MKEHVRSYKNKKTNSTLPNQCLEFNHKFNINIVNIEGRYNLNDQLEVNNAPCYIYYCNCSGGPQVVINVIRICIHTYLVIMFEIFVSAKSRINMYLIRLLSDKTIINKINKLLLQIILYHFKRENNGHHTFLGGSC